jgi:hypothetical protein
MQDEVLPDTLPQEDLVYFVEVVESSAQEEHVIQ